VQGSCKSDRPEPRAEVRKPISLGRIRYERWSENGAARVRGLGSEKGATSGSGVMGLAPRPPALAKTPPASLHRDQQGGVYKLINQAECWLFIQQHASRVPLQADSIGVLLIQFRSDQQTPGFICGDLPVLWHSDRAREVCFRQFARWLASNAT
jgi:hypothetical protein